MDNENMDLTPETSEIAEVKEAETPEVKEVQEVKPAEQTDKTEQKEEKELDYKNTSYENLENIAKTKGIDLDKFKNAFVANGCKLTNSIIEECVKGGVPLDFVQDAAKVYTTLHEQEMDNIAQVIGGRETLTQTLEWAANNLDPQKLDAIRTDLAKNPSETTTKAVVAYLHNQMLEKEGKAPNYITETSGGKSVGDIYKSKAEAIKAMSDPRYVPSDKEFDEAYAKEVDEKLVRTKQANGKPLFD